MGGSIAVGRRRLRWLLLILALVALAVGGAALSAGRTVPGLLAVGAGALTLFARRMSADLEPLWLEIDGGRLVVQMRRQREAVPIPGVRARRLSTDEIAHLRGLATSAGITAGTGGFDSHRLGELDLYASNLDRGVLVDRGETSMVVTPDDPDAFLEALRAAGADA